MTKTLYENRTKAISGVIGAVAGYWLVSQSRKNKYKTWKKIAGGILGLHIGIEFFQFLKTYLSNEVDFIDYSNQHFSTLDGFRHYLYGKGKTIRINFNQVNTKNVKPTYFDEVCKLIKNGTGIYYVDTTKPFSTGDYLVGNITLKLQGKLTVSESDYHFDGILKAFDDTYDFNASTHRDKLAENATTFGRILNGTPYTIQIRGEKRICM